MSNIVGGADKVRHLDSEPRAWIDIQTFSLATGVQGWCQWKPLNTHKNFTDLFPLYIVKGVNNFYSSWFKAVYVNKKEWKICLKQGIRQKSVGRVWLKSRQLEATTVDLCCTCVCVAVYLSVKRLVDVYPVVLALFDEHVPTLPDESCGRVGVDGAAQEHRLLLVVAATHITDGLVHRQHRCVKVCKTRQRNKKKKNRYLCKSERKTLVYARHVFIKPWFTTFCAEKSDSDNSFVG